MIENSIGQMLANPSPAQTTPAIASGVLPAIISPPPINPSRADARKQANGLMTVRTAPPMRRREGKQQEESRWPQQRGLVAGETERNKSRLEEPPHAGLGTNVKENAKHGQREDGFCEQAEAAADAGRGYRAWLRRP